MNDLNKRPIITFFLWIIASIFLSAASFAQDVTEVVKANNQFAFDLYAKYKQKDENIFFSPYSISAALAMTYEGARGVTKEEIQKVFHFPKEDSVLREGFQALYKSINKEDKVYQLHVANALWAQKDFKFLDDYLSIIEQYYFGKATNLDFFNQAESSRITINKWVEDRTNNKIRDLIPQGNISASTRLVITNTVYFKGMWLFEFNKKNTRAEDFYLYTGDTVKAEMMRLAEKHFDYAETENLQILELLYKGNKLSMLILLPKEKNLSVLEDSLTLEKLIALKKMLNSESVNIFIPKLKFETKYFMAEDLKTMGMPIAFTAEADFSGMTGTRNLGIDEVIHQAFVDIDEEGTEAAAATAVETRYLSGSPDYFNKPKIFNADHVFVFIIQDRETGNILFLGRVLNPNE